MDQLALLFVLMFAALVMVPVGERLGLPSPVLMTVLGVLMALAPFVPNVDIPPEFILPLLLPPLLYAAVQRTSWRQFATNWRPIFLLAVALVFVTTAAVAVVANAIVPGLPIAAAVVLGALVAPPDPVAVSAVAGSLGLPRRLVSILEGEGLFNDVTAIVLYNVAIAATVTGTYSIGTGAEDLALSFAVGLATGIVTGWIGARVMAVLGDATLRVGLTLLLPFAGYAVSDHFHGSGVLAVLVTALYLAESGADADDIEGRLTGAAFWQVIDTLITGVAFGLIGLELHSRLRVRAAPPAGYAALGAHDHRCRRRGPAAVAAARLVADPATTPPQPRLRCARLHPRDDRDVVVGNAGRGLRCAGAGDPLRDRQR